MTPCQQFKPLMKSNHGLSTSFFITKADHIFILFQCKMLQYCGFELSFEKVLLINSSAGSHSGDGY